MSVNLNKPGGWSITPIEDPNSGPEAADLSEILYGVNLPQEIKPLRMTVLGTARINCVIQ